MPKLLDLYCGAGGASVGYNRAGFDVVGVDINPQPRYPFEFIQADALEYLKRPEVREFDVIHASPPCQALTQMSARYRGRGGAADEHENLIALTRWAIMLTGMPYVLENVMGAAKHLHNPIVLAGGYFGLRVYRPRFFESTFTIALPPGKPRVNDPVGVYGKNDGRVLFYRKHGPPQRNAKNLADAQDAMGNVHWMEWRELVESIPPTYTEWIGSQILGALELVA